MGAPAAAPITLEIADEDFDSKLTKARCPAENSTLQIILKIFLKPINPDFLDTRLVSALSRLVGGNVPAGTGAFSDWDKVPHLIKPWAASDFRRFSDRFMDQGMMWHNKFWLLPPDDFTLFDLNERGGRFRPNVFCSFKLELTTSLAGAHQTIEVVNLYDPARGFRSDSSHYSSIDTKPASYKPHDSANRIRPTKQPTIAHEIGHALGLPHIGETRGLNTCSAAKAVYDLRDYIDQDWITFIYRGGNGASVCYGEGASVDDIDNIMGFGSKFSKENASPWLDRLKVHLGAAMDKRKWQAVVGRVAPKVIR